MINILIVDNEEYAIEYIVKGIDFESLGIHNIFTASSPLDAITLIVENKIDILLTDICMNDMNGIELAEKAVSYSPGCRIIFISAYSEKEYLMSAIKLRVLAYIEKPIDLEEMERLLANVVVDIRQEKMKNVLEEKVTSAYKDILPYLRQRLTLSLTKKALNYTELYKNIVMAGLKELEGAYALTGVIKFVRKFPADTVDSDIMGTIERRWRVHNFEVLYTLKNENVFVVHFLDKGSMELSQESASSCIEQIIGLFAERYNMLVSLGSVRKGIRNIYESYQSAVMNLEACYVKGYNRISCGVHETAEYDLSEALTDRLIKGYRENSRGEVDAILREIHAGILKHPLTPVYRIKAFYVKILEQTYAAAEAYQVVYFTEERRAALRKQMEEANIFEELHGILSAVTDSFFDNIFLDISNHVRRAMQYICLNYDKKDISIERVSKSVSVTTSYLCVIFKKEAGMTINSYITKLRIEKAKELLRSSNLKMNEIVERIGYIDVKYFFKIFKKCTGMTPNEFRKEL